jgi:hypothetical protein
VLKYQQNGGKNLGTTSAPTIEYYLRGMATCNEACDTALLHTNELSLFKAWPGQWGARALVTKMMFLGFGSG